MTTNNELKHTEDFTLNNDGYYYSKTNTHLRFKIVIDEDPIWGGVYKDFRFEVFKRDFILFKKKWDFVVQTNGFWEGLSFSNHILFG